MRKDKMHRRLAVGALAAAMGAAITGSGVLHTQEVEWNSPVTSLTVESSTTQAPQAGAGLEEDLEVEWN